MVPQVIKEKVFGFIDQALRQPGSSNDIMPGLVPISDTGLYVTPITEPADPTDCARYPDSPFCGGIPISPYAMNLEPSIVNDGCNIGIRLDGALGFIQMPPVALVYRKPECREKDKVELPPPGNEAYVIDISNCNGVVTLVYSGYVFYSVNVFDYLEEALESLRAYHGTGGDNHLGYKTYVEFVNPDINTPFNVPYFVRRQITLAGIPLGTQTITVGQDIPYKAYVLKNLEDEIFIGTCGFYVNHNIGIGINNDPYFFSLGYPHWLPFIAGTFRVESVSCGLTQVPPPEMKDCCNLCPPNDALLKALMKKVNKLYAILGGDVWQGEESPLTIKTKIEEQVRAKGKQIFTNDFQEKEITVNNILEYLVYIAAVGYKRAGYDQLPAELPKRLIYPNAKGEEKIDSLVELLGYQVKQLDRAVGYLPQKIRIADTNPGKPGNQSIEVEIHSISDALKEILQYLIDTEGDVDVTNNMLVRTLYELGFIHQGVVQADAMLDAICDHLDFKQRWKKVKVPFAFDPYAGTKGFGKKEGNAGADAQTEEEIEKLLPQMLQNTEVDIRVLVNDEKKSLNDLLQDIKRDTAAAAAAVSEKATPERLDQLVAAAQMLVQLQGAIDRKNARQALSGGDLRTEKKK